MRTPGGTPTWRRLGRRLRSRARRMSDRSVFALLVAFCVAGTAWSFLDYSRNVRIAGVAIIAMVFGSLLLNVVRMLVLIALLTAGVLVVVAAHDQVSSQLTWSGVVMLTSVAAASIVQVRRRDALGLHRTSAETVLSRVASRLRVQESIPALPHGWRVDVAQRGANRAVFAGDFVSACLHDVGGEPHLDLVLVDVSGSGIEAGSRALLLSGAVGGLLGSVPADELLTRVNEYLRRQGWGSEFASASYLRVNLVTWDYQLRSAGHPPAIMWTAATASARRASSSGTVLGVVPDPAIRATTGRLDHGDLLVVYTDGVVENRDRDLDSGIARLGWLLGRLLRYTSVDGLARRLVETAAGASEDDRTVVVVWNERRGPDRPRATRTGRRPRSLGATRTP